MKNLQKHLLILLILLFATSLTLSGQEWYAKQDGNKVKLTNKSNIDVLTMPAFDKEKLLAEDKLNF